MFCHQKARLFFESLEESIMMWLADDIDENDGDVVEENDVEFDGVVKENDVEVDDEDVDVDVEESRIPGMGLSKSNVNNSISWRRRFCANEYVTIDKAFWRAINDKGTLNPSLLSSLLWSSSKFGTLPIKSDSCSYIKTKKNAFNNPEYDP